MRRTGMLACVLGLTFGISAAAQTKISGTNHCAKPDPQNMVELGDCPNHTFSIAQVQGAWTKPWEMAGTPGKQGTGTFSGEITGYMSRFHAYYVDEMANGDKAYYRYQGTTTLKDGAPQTEEGTGTLTGGTGKLKGAKGKGTYKGKAGSDGTMTYEGSRRIPDSSQATVEDLAT
jgi:hypothetical protein